MGSGIFIRVNMHPIYQHFLRRFYNCYDPVFSFPRFDNDGLMLAHEFIRRIRKPPWNLKAEEKYENEFLIEIPYQKYKKVSSYNYMSKINKADFVELVRKKTYIILISFIEDNIKSGLPVKNAITGAMDYYDIPFKYYEAIWKEYQRYRWRCYKQKKVRKKVYLD